MKSDSNSSSKKKWKMRFPSTDHCTGEKRKSLIQKLLKHPNIFVFSYHADGFLPFFVLFEGTVWPNSFDCQCFCSSCNEPWFKFANLKLDKDHMLSVTPCLAERIVVICFTSLNKSSLDPLSHICSSLARSIPDLLVEPVRMNKLSLRRLVFKILIAATKNLLPSSHKVQIRTMLLVKLQKGFKRGELTFFSSSSPCIV